MNNRCTLSLVYRLVATNGFLRDETVDVLNDKVTINGVIRFRPEWKYKYELFYGYNENGLNITIGGFATDRIPPSTLKSLIG